VDAVFLYRSILAASTDRSVVIVSIGYLTYLNNLISSPADSISDLDGDALVAKKVKKLVCMGGQYPSGREWNFYQDAAAALHVVKHWPIPIVFIGFETGVTVLTGSGLEDTPLHNPVRRGYELYNGLRDRPSWDQLAVFYAAKRGHENFARHWERVTGQNSVSEDGSNQWTDRANGQHAHIRLRKSPEIFASMIEKLMIFSLSPRSE